MLHVKVRWCLGFQCGAFNVLVVYLALIHTCKGVSQLVCPSQPIVATVGDDIIFPCHVEPPSDVSAMTVEWSKPDLNPRFVYVWRDRVELESKKNPSFKGRTSTFISELKHGNISLRLSKVHVSDQGTYRCFIPQLSKDTTIKLDVGAVSSPVVTMTRNSSVVVLQCESKGWYPQPEVFWLDGDGNLLSAGATETVRGPDGLYTVSSRVTVEKRYSNNFTCRVQQNNINQTRETHINVPDDFLPISDVPGPPASSSSSFAPAIIGVIIGIIFILAVVSVVWKWRQNKLKNKESQGDEETLTPEQQSLLKAEREGEMMKNEDKKMNCLSEQTRLQCETEKETHQGETNNVPVQIQDGTVQQSVHEGTNLPVPDETQQQLEDGETQTGLDKREQQGNQQQVCIPEDAMKNLKNPDGEEEIRSMTTGAPVLKDEVDNVTEGDGKNRLNKGETSSDMNHTNLQHEMGEKRDKEQSTEDKQPSNNLENKEEEEQITSSGNETGAQSLKEKEKLGEELKTAVLGKRDQQGVEDLEHLMTNLNMEGGKEEIKPSGDETGPLSLKEKEKLGEERKTEKESDVDKEKERQSQKTRKEREEKALDGRISRYKGLMKKQEDKIKLLSAQLEEVEKRIQSINSEIDDMDPEKQLDEKHHLDILKKKKEELQEELQKTEEALQRNKDICNTATERKMKINEENNQHISDSDEDL